MFPVVYLISIQFLYSTSLVIFNLLTEQIFPIFNKLMSANRGGKYHIRLPRH